MRVDSSISTLDENEPLFFSFLFLFFIFLSDEVRVLGLCSILRQTRPSPHHPDSLQNATASPLPTAANSL